MIFPSLALKLHHLQIFEQIGYSSGKFDVSDWCCIKYSWLGERESVIDVCDEQSKFILSKFKIGVIILLFFFTAVNAFALAVAFILAGLCKVEVFRAAMWLPRIFALFSSLTNSNK